MDADVRDNTEHHRYELLLGEDLAGFVTYRRADGAISFLHTEIQSRFEGHGLGGTLAAGVLDDARKHGLAVLPFCPFISGYIRRHPEYLDLVPAPERPRFELDQLPPRTGS